MASVPIERPEAAEAVYSKRLRSLAWYGGKAGGKAAWIASLLPWRKVSTYVETHGGMGSVLSYRAPVRTEIFNDLDSRVYNWWCMVQQFPEELGWQLQSTPLSREAFEDAVDKIDNHFFSSLDRAVAFYVIAKQACNQNMNPKKSPNWRVTYDATYGSQGRWRSENIADLCERWWNVQLENKPAEELLDRLRPVKDAVIYVDPPYYTADTSAYNVCEVDVPNLTRLLSVQSGQVAISGYRDEWEHLGWQRHELPSKVRMAGVAHERYEVLWTNYDALAASVAGGLFENV